MPSRLAVSSDNSITPTTQQTSYATLDEWRAEAVRLFGPDPLDWTFVCPSCGHRQSVRDYTDARAPEGAVAFSCVGRWLEKASEAFSRGQGPCNYAGGGLFQLNPITIVEAGRKAFAFAAPAPEARS